MPEFDLIRRLVRGARGASDSALVLGVGDDSALIDVPKEFRLAVSTDTLNEGVHFRASVGPADLGHKALAVSLSDLAAMGATPRWAFLNLSLAEADGEWIDAFGAGFFGLAGASGVSLAGGDTTHGPLSVTVTALGLVPPGVALRRSGARPGDAIVVSGALGDAALARRRLDEGQAPEPGLVLALDRPRPRCALGEALRGVASACIDLSDGLGSDMAHLIHASGCGAEIELARLPASPVLSALDATERAKLQTGGGDDYELCFTLPSNRIGELEHLGRAGGVALTVIGRITAGDSVEWLDADGHACPLPAAGYEHFTDSPWPNR